MGEEQGLSWRFLSEYFYLLCSWFVRIDFKMNVGLFLVFFPPSLVII